MKDSNGKLITREEYRSSKNNKVTNDNNDESSKELGNEDIQSNHDNKNKLSSADIDDSTEMAQILDEPIKVKKKRLKPWIFWIFTPAFLVAILAPVYILYNWNDDNKDIKKISENIEETITPVIVEDKGELINPPEEEEEESDYWFYVEQPFYSIDLSLLKEKNPDTVAFIHMENTNINYPIVQTNNNEYYLKHAFDKSRNSAGWVFMDSENNADFSNDNTVIYGHGRLDKTVFGSLKNTLNEAWQSNKENYIIWISTPTLDMVYQIFSIYTIESEGYYIKTSFSSSEEKEKWLTEMKKRNTTPQDTAVLPTDKILTLSTCLNDNGGRIVVQAKLIKRNVKS